jgi:hypothetical protein
MGMAEHLHDHALRLIVFSLVLLIPGARIWLRKVSEALTGFGLMLAVWSAIDVAIGAASLFSPPPSHPQDVIRFIWLNIFLDGAYIAVGLLMTARSQKPFVKGMGWAVQIQGALLLLLDLYLVHQL